MKKRNYSMSHCPLVENHKDKLCIDHVKTLRHSCADNYGTVLLDKVRLLRTVYGTMIGLVDGSVKCSNDAFEKLIEDMNSVIYYYEDTQIR